LTAYVSMLEGVYYNTKLPKIYREFIITEDL